MEKKGFTLIELLVVVGILGILAIGLLAAIDPFEQLKKGRDTNLRNVCVEYVNASTRYYAVHGEMPWGDTPASGSLDDATVMGYTDALIEEGELKVTFQAGLGTANAAKLYLTGEVTPPGAVVCFDPDSKAFSLEATTDYEQNGDGPRDDCPDVDVTCYWCAR